MGTIASSGRRLLLVEDDPTAGRDLVVALTRRSWHVSHAVCASEARTLGRNLRPDAAIVDVELPDGSGFDVVDFLRNLAAPCASVVLTGGAIADGGREAARLSVVDYLIKPVRLDVLDIALRRAAEQTSRMRAWAHRRAAEPSLSALEYSEGPPPQNESNVLAAAVVEFGLTDRQSEALFGVARGLSDKEIQSSMHVSYSRVRQLLTASFRKLGIRGRNQFIKFLAERRARYEHVRNDATPS